MLPPPPCSPLFPYTTSSDLPGQPINVVPAGDPPNPPPPAPGDFNLELVLNATGTGSYMTAPVALRTDRKSTRLNSSHLGISYAVFCLKKKKKNTHKTPRHNN